MFLVYPLLYWRTTIEFIWQRTWHKLRQKTVHFELQIYIQAMTVTFKILLQVACLLATVCVACTSSQATVASKLQLRYSWKVLDWAYPDERTRQHAINAGAYSPQDALPVGIEFYQEKVFVTVPRWRAGKSRFLIIGVKWMITEYNRSVMNEVWWKGQGIARKKKKRVGSYPHRTPGTRVTWYDLEKCQKCVWRHGTVKCKGI